MHPVKLLIASSLWVTSIITLPLPVDDPFTTCLPSQHQEEQQQQQRTHNQDLSLGLTGGFGISTLISAVRNARFRSDTNRQTEKFKRKYVELRNRLPLDQPEVRETYWDGMDDFFADEKLVACMKNNLGIEDDWDPPMYISPDRWNAVGPSCPGWKSTFKASPGSFRNIIPSKRENGGRTTTKGSTEEERPQPLSLEWIPERIMDSANRLTSVGTKAVATNKGSSWLPKVQRAPSLAPILVP